MDNIADEMLALVEKTTSRANREQEGDYRKEGVLYCGKCNTPKEYFIERLGKKQRCVCRCADEEERKRKEDETRSIISKLRVECFGSDSSLFKCTFDNADGKDSDIFGRAKYYVKEFDNYYKQGKGMLFYGGVGSGKTYLVACIANALIDKQKRCLLTDFPSINCKWNNINERDKIIPDLLSYDLLIIDDFGAERKTDSMVEMVYTIIDKRLKANKPIVLTSNISKDELLNPQNLSDRRIISRLYESVIPYDFTCEDRRKAKMIEAKKEFEEAYNKSLNAI